MNDIERALNEALSARSGAARPGHGSVMDVRLRARRRARRRTAVGAGAMLAVGTIGAVAFATRSSAPRHLSSAGNGTGDNGNGGVAVPGEADGAPIGNGVWRCTSRLSGPSDGSIDPIPTVTIVEDTAVPTTLVPDGAIVADTSTTLTDPGSLSTTTTALLPSTISTSEPAIATSTIVAATVATIEVGDVPQDGVYYFSDCSFTAEGWAPYPTSTVQYETTTTEYFDHQTTTTSVPG